MNDEIRALYEKRAQAREDARRLQEDAEKKCAAENRDITSEEEASVRKALADYRSLGLKIEVAEAQLEEDRTVETSSEIADDLRRTKPEVDLAEAADGNREAQERLEMRAAEMWFVAKGDKELRSRYADELAVIDKAQASGELRALAMDNDIYGGYMVAPQKMASMFIQAVDNAFPLRQFAHIETLQGAHSLGAIALDNDPADADWTSEVAAVSFDSTMSFGGRELAPSDLSKGIKVSLKLLRHSARPIEALVKERLAYKVGVPLETAAMTGMGSNQPLGLFTADSAGLSTSIDVSTSNSTTAPTFDNAKTCKYTLKAQYWPQARWLMHRDTALKYALIKDGEGRYIWQDGVVAGDPSRLMGFPVSLSEYAPNTFTTGLYVAILGDFSYYWFADSEQITFTRLDELYRANRQVGFLVEASFDGMPVLEEAFIRVTLA